MTWGRVFHWHITLWDRNHHQSWLEIHHWTRAMGPLLVLLALEEPLPLVVASHQLPYCLYLIRLSIVSFTFFWFNRSGSRLSLAPDFHFHLAWGSVPFSNFLWSCFTPLSSTCSFSPSLFNLSSGFNSFLGVFELLKFCVELLFTLCICFFWWRACCCSYLHLCVRVMFGKSWLYPYLKNDLVLK